MLHIIDSFNQLPFSALMEIYKEGNAENGVEKYPQLPPVQQLAEAEQDFYVYLTAFFRQPDSRYFLWEDEGRFVSALRIEPYEDGYLIAALETEPHSRNRGYAKMLLDEALSWIWKHNPAPVYSHISRVNKPSLAVHNAVGFKAFLSYCRYADGSVSHNALTLRYVKKTL